MVSKIFKNLKKNVWLAENIYHLKTGTDRISKLLYQYEIYKKILKLPGDVVECGVFKGASFVRFLTFRFNLESQFKRKIYGFDVFGKFPEAQNKLDIKFLKKWKKNAGDGILKHELDILLKKKHFKNFQLIKGEVQKTIPKFLKKNNLKISLLHLDMDVYEPTRFVLDNLFSKIVKGGIILIDDYQTVYGATKAIKEFLKKNKKLKLQKLRFNSVPWFIIKK